MSWEARHKPGGTGMCLMGARRDTAKAFVSSYDVDAFGWQMERIYARVRVQRTCEKAVDLQND